MDTFFILWVFDSRWAFCIKPRPQYWVLVFPILVDLLTIAGIIVDKETHLCYRRFYLVENIIILGLLCTAHLYIIFWVYCSTKSKMINISKNQKEIQNFFYQYEYRKAVWSWAGLSILILSILLLITQRIYLQFQQCQSRVNLFRFYLDLVCWVYKLAAILIFFLCKIIYLLAAWRYPSCYIKFKNIL